jgi:formimidoylglutamate deiminase
MSPSSPPRLFTERALLPGGWARDVAFTLDADGSIAAIEPGGAPGDAERLAGPVVPAMGNLHSHSFQRAMAGLAEVASDRPDSFWSWRTEMYRLTGLLDPDDIQVIAEKLFVELLKGGYGAVAEFHYLHHDRGGVPYGDPAELSRRILAASEATGLGVTLLPVFYAHADFGGIDPTPGQARFIHDVDAYRRLLDSLERDVATAGASLGCAIHSLRAATPGEMHRILDGRAGPIHIHVAEQPREVEACLAWSGRRPVQVLLDDFALDRRWCLIHATHMTAQETAALAATGAVAGLCPATEANLGDGLFPAPAFRSAGGRFGIGTDSHVATTVAEELRTLEYGQRLRDLGRNRLADGPGRSVGRSLFDAALAGGAQALGRGGAGLAVGQPADLVVLDGADPFIATAKDDQILDRWIFALGNKPVVRDVMVRGCWRVQAGRHARDEAIDACFTRVLRKLAA